MKTETTARRGAIGVLAGATLLSLCAPAIAQDSSPWYLGVQQRFTHQDNVYNSAAATTSDNISGTTLLGGLELRPGRQRFFGDFSATANRYQDSTALNHTAYNARVGLDWETVERISGNFWANAYQTLSDFSPAGLPGSTTKNLYKAQTLYGGIRVGVVTRLTGEVSLMHNRVRNSDPLRQITDSDIDELSIGLRYRPGSALSAGVAWRTGKGNYPRYVEPLPGQFVDEGFKRNFIDLTADYELSGASKLEGRISYGKDTYDTAKIRDFSGVTGSLGWKWQPTGKLKLNTTFLRDTGDNFSTTAAPTAPVLVQSASLVAINSVRNSLTMVANYELTSKIGIAANLSYGQDTSINPTAGTRGTNRTNGLGLGIKWMPTRAITAGCDISRVTRSGDSYPTSFDQNAYGCFGEFVLR
jgi:hypothetical protein